MTQKQHKNLWRRAGLVFQDCADQLFCASVKEEMMFGLRRLGLSMDECLHRAADALVRVGMQGFENRVPLHLSGGNASAWLWAVFLPWTRTCSSWMNPRPDWIPGEKNNSWPFWKPLIKHSCW